MKGSIGEKEHFSGRNVKPLNQQRSAAPLKGQGKALFHTKLLSNNSSRQAGEISLYLAMSLAICSLRQLMKAMEWVPEM